MGCGWGNGFASCAHWLNYRVGMDLGAGPTKLSNLVLLCRRHHRSVHEDGFQVERLADGELQFRRPDGWLMPEVPEPPDVAADAAEVLRAQNKAAGAIVDAETLRPDWDGTRFDVGDAIDVMHPRAIGY